MSKHENQIVSSSPNMLMAIVLSGGAGQRFDGLDKGLQAYDNTAMVKQIIGVLEPQVDSIIVSINRNREIYEKITQNLVFDEEPEYQGPLAGIIAAMAHLENLENGNLKNFSHFLICPCDTPLLPMDYAARLIAKLANSQHSIAVAHDGQRRQNLHCLIASQSMNSLQDFYQNGGRAMHRWHHKEGSADVDFSDQASCFLNINRPEQLKYSI